MADIKIIIDGQVAELPPNGLNLPLTYSLRSREGLAINSGSRSEYAFELPGTKHNDNIFNQFYDPAIYTITEQAFLSASIEVDGLPFFIGRCQLQSVTLRQDQYFWQGKSYKVAFYGNNADWSTRIGDLLIKDLTFTPHVYSYTDNYNAWYFEYPTSDFKYLPLKLKDWAVFGEVDALLDSHPALFIVDVITKTFASVGYTLNSFFFTTDFFKRLIMPVPILNRYLQGQYGKDYLNISVFDTQINTNVSGGTVFILPNQTVFPLVGPNPYNAISGIYTVPDTGFYLLQIECTVSNITTTAGISLAFMINGAPPSVFYGQANLTPPQPYTNDTTVTGEAVFSLNVGDTVQVVGLVTIVSPGTFDYNIVFTVIGEAEIIDSTQLDLKYIIDPSLKAIDLIRGIAHAFNLVFETNEGSRTVQIEPADQFLLQSREPDGSDLEDGFYEDPKLGEFSPYVDLSKGGELVSDTKQLSQLRLKWKDDSNDPTAEALNLNANLGILEARYNFPTSRFKVGETVVENPFFAPTLVIADNEIRDANSLKTPMIPIIWATNYLETSTSAETVTQILPRLLVSDPTLSFADFPNGTINVYDGAATNPQANPLNYMVDYNDTVGFQTSLSFGDVTVNGFSTSGLLKRFYLSEMVRKKGGKYLELFILWDVLMIQNLTFRNKILINNNTYILQEINTFDVAKNQSTKTYFVLDYKEVGADADIQSTILEAKINTI
jgi:hypothetical protein